MNQNILVNAIFSWCVNLTYNKKKKYIYIFFERIVEVLPKQLCYFSSGNKKFDGNGIEDTQKEWKTKNDVY